MKMTRIIRMARMVVVVMKMRRIAAIGGEAGVVGEGARMGDGKEGPEL